MKENSNVSVVGAGAWGTALALTLATNGHNVKMWVYGSDEADGINAAGENRLFLPGVRLPKNIWATPDLAESVKNCKLIIVAIPTQFMRKSLNGFKHMVMDDAVVVSASKGVENESLETPVDIIRESLHAKTGSSVCCLSGPTFAKELAKKLPTAATIASKDVEAAKFAQAAMSSPFFRLYVHHDVIGVEIGGAVKNVIAIAAGIADGLGFGHNTRAALITRGLMEIKRLGLAMGAEAETFSGLSGMGDLVLTCTGDLSRNRTVGLRLGKGESLESILGSMTAVAEGVATTLSTYRLSEKIGVDMPIVAEVYRVLYEGKNVKQAVADLLGRELKSEFY